MMQKHLPPILYHYFSLPTTYSWTLNLQEWIHRLQLKLRDDEFRYHKDVLLLLQHRPTYTAGRRQKADEVDKDRERLLATDADVELTKRGGQYTYHGPGQLVGYPLIDLGRTRPPISVRDYVGNIERTLKEHLRDAHGIEGIPADSTGVFLDDGKAKIASIGVQVRHRLTTHGFAINVTEEPKEWFEEIVACGAPDVKAVSIAERSKKKSPEEITVADEVPGIVEAFGRVFGRDMQKMKLSKEGELGGMIQELGYSSRRMGEWPHRPITRDGSLPSSATISSTSRLRPRRTGPIEDYMDYR